jgi:hypothetical protein
MSRELRYLMILIGTALALWAAGALIYRSGILTDAPNRIPDGNLQAG